MKKLIFPILIVLLLLASVTPVFAKGKGPNGHGKGLEGQLLQGAPQSEDPEDSDSQLGKSGQHGNPHGDKMVRQNGNANKGQNFVLFGKVESVGDGMMNVTVESGNNMVKDLIGGPAITVTVDADYTVIRVMDENPSVRAALKDVPVGATVRVHGWLTRGDPTAQEATPDTWTARQINVFSVREADDTTEPIG